jgi:hypothetical protein
MNRTREIQVETLRTFIMWQIKLGTDYATAFARACAPFGEVEDFEEKFDAIWDQHDVCKLQN